MGVSVHLILNAWALMLFVVLHVVTQMIALDFVGAVYSARATYLQGARVDQVRHSESASEESNVAIFPPGSKVLSAL